MDLRKSLLRIICIVFLILLLPLTGLAIDYPEKSVTMIITFSAGGSTDVMSRIVASELEDILGERFLVENKPGAGGEIGWTALSKADPDGYTIGNFNIPSAITKYVQREASEYRLEDFLPIANIITDPGILVVRDESEFMTLEDLVSYLKENPKAITATHEGLGGDDFIAQKRLEEAAGIEFTGVQFDGDAPARAALMGGHIACSFINVSEAFPMIEAGNARALGVMTKERISALPNVSTFREQGYDIVGGSSRGFVAPSGFPEEYRSILINALEEIVNSEEFINKMDELQMPIEFISGDEYGEMLIDAEESIKSIWEKEPWL